MAVVELGATVMDYCVRRGEAKSAKNKMDYEQSRHQEKNGFGIGGGKGEVK